VSLNASLGSAGSINGLGAGALWDNGQLMMLLAAQCMAAGTLMVPWVTRYVDPVMATGWHMLLGGVPLVTLSAVTERSELAEHLAQITPGAPGMSRRPAVELFLHHTMRQAARRTCVLCTAICAPQCMPRLKMPLALYTCLQADLHMQGTSPR
jgi:EamA-like transporter family